MPAPADAAPAARPSRPPRSASRPVVVARHGGAAQAGVERPGDGRLRSGEVLAAVTTDPAPVQGCRTVALGALRYAATASPDFVRWHFPDGVDAAALARAPILRFDRRDGLQARWAREALGVVGFDAPAHWIPSTQGFVDGALAGLGWGMNPLALVEAHLAAGRLVEMLPGQRLDVALHWQHARLGARLLDAFTGEVVTTARKCLVQAGAPEGS